MGSIRYFNRCTHFLKKGYMVISNYKDVGVIISAPTVFM